MGDLAISIFSANQRGKRDRAIFDIWSNTACHPSTTTLVRPHNDWEMDKAGEAKGLHLTMQLFRAQPPPGADPLPVHFKELTTNAPQLPPGPRGKGPANMVSCIVTDIRAFDKAPFDPQAKKKKKKTQKKRAIVEVGLAVQVLVGCNVELSLEVELEVGGRTLVIPHLLLMECETTVTKELGPIAPFEPPPLRPHLPTAPQAVDGAVFPGLEERNQLDEKLPLPMFPVPMAVRVLLASRFSVPTDKGHSDELIAEVRQCAELLDAPLTEESYVPKLSLLLHLEELQHQRFLSSYTMESRVYLKEKPDPMAAQLETENLYEMCVPGLADGLPKVGLGDLIHVTVLRSQGRYEGLVRARTSPSAIAVGMPEQFESEVNTDRDECKVEFAGCRVPVRMQQRALRAAEPLLGSLFPRQAPAATAAQLPQLDFLNPKVAKNAEQSKAVSHIVGGGFRPAPYIVFGGPGTGKTTTLVEAVAQLVRSGDSVRVLVCASSDDDVDHLTRRLLVFLPASAVVRLNAPLRDLASLTEPGSAGLARVLAVSPLDEAKQHFVIPPAEVLEEKKVILSTLCNAGRLATAGLGAGWLDGVFVDEAGRSLEPETLVALGGLAGPQTRIVLAGDPHQLGPVLHSRRAANKGLSTSLMERLMRDFPCYAARDPRFITTLARNFRCHAELLKVPSWLFYAGNLVSSAETASDVLSRWARLPCPDVPLIFHGIIGSEEREASDPSHFNRLELVVAKTYVEALTARDVGVQSKHIGMVAPCGKQARKAKVMFSRELERYGDMATGTVEEFQGVQRRVIVLSTVRSSPDCLGEEVEGSGLGVLADPKLFNTAVSRAKALLIVVGNPYVLQRAAHWRALLAFALERGAYRGVAFRL